MRRIAIAIQGGFACAYQSPRGYLVAESDHPTRESAQREADRINAEQAAALARAQAARFRQHAYAERRPVRWFEPDAFA